MDKLFSFDPGQITGIDAHVAWASLEIVADEDVAELERILEKGGK